MKSAIVYGIPVYKIIVAMPEHGHVYGARAGAGSGAITLGNTGSNSYVRHAETY
jgi:hypothetical protein